MKRESAMWDKPVGRYLRDALPPALLTLVVAALMMHFEKSLGPMGKTVFLVVLMLCYGWCGWIEFRHLKRCDELRRRLELEAMMLAFISAAGIILTLFFANAMKLLDVPFSAALMVMMGCYLVCQVWARLRYRYWALL
jgi:hypothetical protein